MRWSISQHQSFALRKSKCLSKRYYYEIRRQDASTLRGPQIVDLSVRKPAVMARLKENLMEVQAIQAGRLSAFHVTVGKERPMADPEAAR